MFRRKKKQHPLQNIDIWLAAADGNIAAIQYHLTIGTDINSVTDRGDTPLHYAAAHAFKPNYHTVVELLLKNGANPQLKNAVGKTAYDLIADIEDPNVENIKRLLLAEIPYSQRLKAIGFDLNDIPDDLCDPVSLEIMEEPITVSSKITYDRKSLIEQFEFQGNPDTIECPMTMLLIVRVEVELPIDVDKKACIESFVVEQEDLAKARNKPHGPSQQACHATLFHDDTKSTKASDTTHASPISKPALVNFAS